MSRAKNKELRKRMEWRPIPKSLEQTFDDLEKGSTGNSVKAVEAAEHER